MDDLKVGAILRAIRLHAGLRQADVAARAGVSQSRISNAEQGKLGSMPLDNLRTIAREVGVRLELSPLWRGGAFDRLLDRGHAELGERVASHLRRYRHEVLLEYSFNHFGERGSVDVVGWHESSRSLVLIELKTRVYNLQDLLSSSHRKARVVPALLRRERGWSAANLGHFLVLAETRANRSLLKRYAMSLDSAFPARTSEVKRWLKHPAGGLGGVWFLADISGTDAGRDETRRKRPRATRLAARRGLTLSSEAGHRVRELR
jgi:transcriptional regulator with XRE-family HTH domain